MAATRLKTWALVCTAGWMLGAAAPELERGTVDEPALSVQRLVRGRAARRVQAQEGADLVLLYGGEQGGDPRTCGCLERPLGSISRAATYAQAAKKAYPDALLLNVGAFLADTLGADGGLHAEAIEGNDLMLMGLSDWDVLNITVRDLPYLAATARMPEQAVSANLTGPLDLPKVRRFDVGGRRVNITGVSGPRGMLPIPEGFGWTDPTEAVRSLVEAEPDATWVVLAWGVGREVKQLTSIPGVAVLIDGNNYAQHFEGVSVDDTLWLRSRWQTQALGDVRLAFEGQRVVGANERVVELDRSIGEDPLLMSVQRQYDKRFGATKASGGH